MPVGRRVEIGSWAPEDEVRAAEGDEAVDAIVVSIGAADEEAADGVGRCEIDGDVAVLYLQGGNERS